MQNEKEYEEIRIWEYDHRDKEPGIPVHDIFTRPIPGAFGIEFLNALIAGVDEKE